MDTPPWLLPISGDRDVSLPLSLEWPVWSSSSGNNCHPVQRPLRCVSLWEYNGIFFTSSHFISQFPPTRFPLITATGALPWMAFLAGSTGQNLTIMSILCSTADAASSGSWPILFKVLTLNGAICIVWLYFSSFLLFELCSWFFKHWSQGSDLSGRFLPARRAMWFMYVVWVWVMVMFRWLFLFSSIEATLIEEQQ